MGPIEKDVRKILDKEYKDRYGKELREYEDAWAEFERLVEEGWAEKRGNQLPSANEAPVVPGFNRKDP